MRSNPVSIYHRIHRKSMGILGVGRFEFTPADSYPSFKSARFRQTERTGTVHHTPGHRRKCLPPGGLLEKSRSLIPRRIRDGRRKGPSSSHLDRSSVGDCPIHEKQDCKPISNDQHSECLFCAPSHYRDPSLEFVSGNNRPFTLTLDGDRRVSCFRS